jgi:hypothetical protein
MYIIKAFSKQRIEGNSLNLSKGINKTPAVRNIHNGEGSIFYINDRNKIGISPCLCSALYCRT